MKINERAFNSLDKDPILTQNLDGHMVDVYLLNDYPDIKQELVNSGKFYTWASIDGVNYKLVVENDFYEKFKELFSEKVNQIWLEFWDECDALSTKFSKKIVLPGTLIVILAFILSTVLLKNYENVSMYVTLGIAAAYFFIVMVIRKYTSKKINESNLKAITAVKAIIGEERFDEILEEQRVFKDEYYQHLQEEADRLDALFEAEEAKREALALNEDNEENTDNEEVEEHKEEDQVESEENK